jgi:hypothetical protein
LLGRTFVFSFVGPVTAGRGWNLAKIMALDVSAVLDRHRSHRARTNGLTVLRANAVASMRACANLMIPFKSSLAHEPILDDVHLHGSLQNENPPTG